MGVWVLAGGNGQDRSTVFSASLDSFFCFSCSCRAVSTHRSCFTTPGCCRCCRCLFPPCCCWLLLLLLPFKNPSVYPPQLHTPIPLSVRPSAVLLSTADTDRPPAPTRTPPSLSKSPRSAPHPHPHHPTQQKQAPPQIHPQTHPTLLDAEHLLEVDDEAPVVIGQLLAEVGLERVDGLARDAGVDGVLRGEVPPVGNVGVLVVLDLYAGIEGVAGKEGEKGGMRTGIPITQRTTTAFRTTAPPTSQVNHHHP